MEEFLKVNLEEFFKETNSKVAEKILSNFDVEQKKFKQICPIEMLDKLDNPVTLSFKNRKSKLIFEKTYLTYSIICFSNNIFNFYLGIY